MSGYPSPPTLGSKPSRRKTEVYWSGLVAKVFTPDTDINLIGFLKALPAPAFGTLAPFFNTASNKFNVFNDGSSVAFKINISGTWSSGSLNRSMQIDFVGTNGNRLVASRDAAVTLDVITLATFFSVDRDGFLSENGSSIVLRSNGGLFAVDSILLIAEQVTSESSISAI